MGKAGSLGFFPYLDLLLQAASDSSGGMEKRWKAEESLSDWHSCHTSLTHSMAAGPRSVCFLLWDTCSFFREPPNGWPPFLFPNIPKTVISSRVGSLQCPFILCFQRFFAWSLYTFRRSSWTKFFPRLLTVISLLWHPHLIQSTRSMAWSTLHP